MKVQGRHYRTLWLDDDGETPCIIDQRALPHRFEIARLRSLADAERAIREMAVRGAPLIGGTAAYGLCLGLGEDASDAGLARACASLEASRPTAVDLANVLAEMRAALAPLPAAARREQAYRLAQEHCDRSAEACQAIGRHGLALLRERAPEARPLQVLTHCNAGWLATVDHGTALAPIYAAHDAGLAVHVWVDETRPRAQGAKLTAWELGQHGVPHTLVPDAAAAHLFQTGRVDLCIVGSDRVTASGDVCNKIGTYGVALAAQDNRVPFFAAFPFTTIDWSLDRGLGAIPIEERDPEEVLELSGVDAGGRPARLRMAPADTVAANFAFDVTPARLVSALVTERGVCAANAEGLAGLRQSRP